MPQDVEESLSHNLDQLSRTDLIKLVLEQQLRLKTLEAAVHRLEQQAAGEKAAVPPHRLGRCPVNYLLPSQSQVWQGEDKSSDLTQSHSLFPPLCAEVMLELGLQEELKQLTHLRLTEQQTKMEKAIRNALRFLNDTAYLDRCQLIQVLTEVRQVKIDGHGLQQMLHRAIDRLKPRPGQPGYSKWRIRYDILFLTYREKQSPKKVAEILSLSERQYYRELKGAIEGIMDHL
ncbi:MAG: hypothetical protein HS114_00810 [Anaerolineales bacterium]|nr:hypothetical protein [Anaerolineales bacterium]